jgi:hypothetical protein
MKKAQKLTFYFLIFTITFSFLWIFLQIYFEQGYLIKHLGYLASPYFKIFLIILLLILWEIFHRKMSLLIIFKKYYFFILFLWKIIYKNNKAKIYVFLIFPIIFFEISLILTLIAEPKNSAFFFLYFYSFFMTLAIALSLRTDEDIKDNYCLLSDEKISNFINSPFRKIKSL